MRTLRGAQLAWFSSTDGRVRVAVDPLEARGDKREFTPGVAAAALRDYPGTPDDRTIACDTVIEFSVPERELSAGLMHARALARQTRTRTYAPEPEPDAASPWAARVAPCEVVWFTHALPRREWALVDTRTPKSGGVIPRGKVGLLLAEGGAGKTMALMQWAIAHASGVALFGCFAAPRPGGVLVVLGEEDTEEARRRAFHARRAMLAKAPAPGAIAALTLAGVPCSMVESDTYGNATDAPFLVWLRGYLKEHGPFGLVLVDPLSRFAGADAEIDNAAATRFVQALESIATETGATVIVAHHTNKTSRGNGATVSGSSARGSSAICDGVRWAASLSSERVQCGDADVAARLGEVVTFAVVKSNYSRKSEPVPLRRDPDNGGALLPLDAMDMDIVAAARAGAAPASRRRVARDADREEREARDAAARRQRADDAEAKAAARHAQYDAALRACVEAEPGLNEARLLSAMRARLGACGDSTGRTAIERARLAGWLDVRTGPKNAKGHFVRGRSS